MEALAQKQLNIYSSFSLSSDDVSTLSLLYTPLIGSEAVMVYFGFQSLLERNNLKSVVWWHIRHILFWKHYFPGHSPLWIFSVVLNLPNVVTL